MVGGKFISATTHSVMTRYHGTGTAELPNPLLIQGRDQEGMQRTTTNHAVRVTAPTVLATIVDAMATHPHLKSTRVNTTDKMNTRTSVGMNCLSSQFRVPLSTQDPNTSWLAVCQTAKNVAMHAQNGNIDRVLTPIKALFGRRQHDEMSGTQVEYNTLDHEQGVQELEDCDYYLYNGDTPHCTLASTTPGAWHKIRWTGIQRHPSQRTQGRTYGGHVVRPPMAP